MNLLHYAYKFEKLIDSRNMYGLKNTRSSENVKSWCEI